MSLILVIHNVSADVSALAPISDYRYQVLVGDGTLDGSCTLALGMITGHRRADGWQKLVSLLLEKEDVLLTTSADDSSPPAGHL